MKIFSPAKINLFLQVLGKRSDGYHDLMTLMCCIGLYDTVSLTFGVQDIAVSCRHPVVPEDDEVQSVHVSVIIHVAEAV